MEMKAEINPAKSRSSSSLISSSREISNNNTLTMSGSGIRRDLEAEEIAANLNKLQSLIPDLPRKRKLSNLEVIQRVIKYICVLQTKLDETSNAVVHEDFSGSSSQPLSLKQQPLLSTNNTDAPTKSCLTEVASEG